MVCDCEKFQKYVNNLNNCIFIAELHGFPYNGGIFKYCPWCGKELKELVSNSKLDNTLTNKQ